MRFLAVLPVSIGGRLTTSSMIDGFIQNGLEALVYDELKQEDFSKYLEKDFDFILGYDFSPIKLKADFGLKIPLISYFSDEIDKKTAGVGYLEYKKYLKDEKNHIFYWDRALTQKENQKNITYMPHFVNEKIYFDFNKNPKYDVLFMGRLDTSLRLDLFLYLNKRLKNFSFGWHAIEKHYLDALSRLKDEEDRKIIKKAYRGFIDNEKDMSRAINDYKIVYNVNAQGKSSLNYRTIQTLASKRLLISDEREELDLFSNLIPTYKTKEDLAEKIEFYLKNKEKREEISKKCQEIVFKNHSAKVCTKKMLEIAKL